MPEDYMALYRKALTGLETGGKTLEASLQEIEEGKRQAIGRGQQALVGGGLGGTTIMGAVPVQAEKIAARQRLGARGRAEETYLTTLASFAAFAQRGEEAQKQREFASRQSYLQRQSQEAMQMRGMQTPLQTIQPSGRGYAEQFPSIYDQGEAVPDWAGAGGVSGLSPAAQMFQTGVGDEGRFDIDFGPGTLVGDVGGLGQAVTAGLPPSAQVGGGWLTAPEYRAKYGITPRSDPRVKIKGTTEGHIRFMRA